MTQTNLRPKKGKIKRRFLGLVDRNASPIEKKELKAYLKGHTYFNYGKDDGFPVSHKVRQEYYTVNQ